MTIHGSWIPAQSSYLFVWGETWRTSDAVAEACASQSSAGGRSGSGAVFRSEGTSELCPDCFEQAQSVHPFNFTQEELLASLKSERLLVLNNGANLAELIEERWRTEVICLPSQTKETVLPLLSVNQTVKATLHPWQVAGIYLNPLEAIAFLQALPLSSFQETDIGSDLRFWGQVYRWCLDLLARGKFLPGSDQLNGTVRGYWQPLLDSLVDQARLAKFVGQMPSACRAYGQDGDRFIDPQELLLHFLSRIVDAQLRRWIEAPASKATMVQQWLQTLADDSTVPADPEIQRINTALRNWTFPIQNYLVTASDRSFGQNFRVCFSLVPPSAGEMKWGYVDWKLTYSLQALDDSDLLIDASTIWQHPVQKLVIKEHTIDQPQEMLLKGLGLASRLYEPIKESLQENLPTQCTLNPIQVYEFVRASAWQLQDHGLGVILPPGLASGAGEKRLGVKIDAQVKPKRGERLGLQSLLKYDLKLAVGEQTISQQDFERLLEQKSPLVEINGEWIALQPADVRAAQQVLTHADQPMQLSVEDALRLSTGDTKVIAKLPLVSFEASGVLQELINNLTNNQSIEPIAPPKEFRGELRPYQARGVAWLAFLERWGLGACLADDMGLGKTPQLIAFLLTLKEQDALEKPTLVVCPTSVLNNWEREVKKFAPTLSTFLHHGDQRPKGKAFAKAVKNQDLVITSYPIVYRDEQTLAGVDWQGVVLDEAQNIKNPQAKQSQAVRKLAAGFRIALTGTPVENRLSELWSILDFLNPEFLGTRQFFQRRFAIPIEKYGDQDSLATLRSLVRPFILRRLKTDTNIIQDLPQKQEMNVFCGLSAQQAQLYQTLVDESLSEIEASEGIQRRGLILTLLMKLKQICNHPAQFHKEKSIKIGDRSGKLLRLEEMLEEMVEEGDRALIFTQFAEWGKLLKPYLEKKLGAEVLFLYGATRRPQRQEMIDRFQNDPNGPPIFILSLKAGGTGLNLTRANHVFHVDRWWNPAVENQATDRAFRIGQKRNVQVHKFVCTGTLEERINDMLESKKQLAETTVDAGEQWLTEIDTDQLRNLLLLDRDAVIDEDS